MMLFPAVYYMLRNLIFQATALVFIVHAYEIILYSKHSILTHLYDCIEVLVSLNLCFSKELCCSAMEVATHSVQYKKIVAKVCEVCCSADTFLTQESVLLTRVTDQYYVNILLLGLILEFVDKLRLLFVL